MTPIYIDDNFGVYEIESDEDVEFYHSVQKRSVLKKCDGCGRQVRLLPDYGYCDRCATLREGGF